MIVFINKRGKESQKKIIVFLSPQMCNDLNRFEKQAICRVCDRFVRGKQGIGRQEKPKVKKMSVDLSAQKSLRVQKKKSET